MQNLPKPSWRNEDDEVKLFLVLTSKAERGNGLKLWFVMFKLDIRKQKIFH